MKTIVYCVPSLDLPGGREKIMTMKENYLSAHGWKVFFVTTNQGGRPPFFGLSPNITVIDLNIQYRYGGGTGSFISDFFHNRRCYRLHRKKLEKILMQVKADIAVSTFLHELSFLYKIKDGSKKVVELHSNRYFRNQQARIEHLSVVKRMQACVVTFFDTIHVRHYDAFVVLTKKDASLWGKKKNLHVIGNPLTIPEIPAANTHLQRIIAVGRLSAEKGFDTLIKCFASIPREDRKGWTLDIYGGGEFGDVLQGMINDLHLDNEIHIRKPTNNIAREYANSGIFCMTSQYEGFGLALCEAMYAGLPAVAFDCYCGPSDIIADESMGVLVPMGREDLFVEKLQMLMASPVLRKTMGEKARRSVIERYSIESVMTKWMTLFQNLLQG